MTTEHGNDADYRLPRKVLPRHYSLELSPHLGSATFSGHVAIELDVVEPAGEVVLNAAELDVSLASWRRSDSAEIHPLEVRLDEALERAVFVLPGTAEPGSYVLECSFSGLLNDKLRGFYRSRFTGPDGVEHTIATTHFESTDARRAFP
jgi:puromycin-sensitive aminopeptidase